MNIKELQSLGRKILYQLTGFRNGTIHCLDYPFTLDEAGRISYLIPSGRRNINITKYDRNINVEPQTTYNLFVWDSPLKGWKKVDNSRSNENANLFFANLPIRGLYKIEPESGLTDAVRPFTINLDQTQQWW